MKMIGKFLGFVIVIMIANPSFAQARIVNCTQENLQLALDRAKPGDTLLIEGICKVVTIVKDGITLQDQNDATIDGEGKDAITIEGVQRVVLIGLTIRNGNMGIYGRRGTAFTVEDTVVENNASDGILVTENSTLFLGENVFIHNNTGSGVLILQNSSAQLGGAEIKHNGNTGVGLRRNASAHLEGAEISDNGVGGLAILESSHLTADNITVQNNNTGNAGNGGVLVDSSTARINDSTISANYGHDVRLQFGAIVKIFRSNIAIIVCGGSTVLLGGERTCP